MKTGFLAAGVIAAALAGSAHAQVELASFSYDSLSGSFLPLSPGTGTFIAQAVDAGLLRTTGSFNRTVPVIGNAVFNPGFVSALDPADIVISMSLSSITATTASATGNLLITDVDGTTVSASITGGSWTLIAPGFSTFAGTLQGVTFGGNADGTFNGNSGSWSTSLPSGSNPLEGAIVSITLGGGTGFFNTGFGGRATGVSGQIIPTPGALALLGVAGLAAARRRR